MKLPGLVDVHVHLRVPGGEHKEDFISGSAAAVAGGFTCLMAMPNTQPPIHTLERWKDVQQRAHHEGLCDIYQFTGTDATHISELAALGEAAPALKLYLDHTYTQSILSDRSLLEEIAQVWPRHKVLAVHAEGDSIATAIYLAEQFRRPVHICHVSRKEDIERIAAGKQRGLPLTCEVTPHHLFLTQTDARRLGALGDMRPCLGSQQDVDALWQHINSTIDCIATDHAPHTLEEKNDPHQLPPGVPGLESALPLMLTALAQKRISLQRLIELMHVNPCRIYGLPEQTDTWIEVDPQAGYTFPEHPLQTRCGWSPFSGMHMQGRIQRVVLRGKEVFADGRLAPSDRYQKNKNKKE